MSLIGTLERFSLAHVLQRIEAYGKTGLFKIQQGTLRVELYFREGRLMCLGPVHVSATLGERLRQSGVISAQALQETLLVIGDAPLSETRMAITLMELGHVGRDELRAWAMREASDVLQVILKWPSGELYFEEDVHPPSDRLLVALSVTSLLPVPAAAVPEPTPAAQPQPAQASVEPVAPAARNVSGSARSAHVQGMQGAVQPGLANERTLFEASQFVSETSLATQSPPAPLPDSPLPANTLLEDVNFSFAEPQEQEHVQPEIQPLTPMWVAAPMPPKRIDTSFLRPDTVLVPVDFSALRAENRRLQITPDQWQLLTRVDGRTTLQTACAELSLLPATVCQLAGELIAEGLVHATVPATKVDELSPVSREMIASGLGNGYVTPGAAAQAAAPFAAVTPTTDALRPYGFPSSSPIETQSQWGNGGNGATFVPGRGWVTGITGSQPLPRLQQGGQPHTSNDAYAPVGGIR